MKCELISVGTEILLGDILNTNARYLAEELAKLGISVMYQTSVGDNEERLLDALRIATERNDAVILTGGLGPTPDDITKQTAAKFFGKTLYEDEKLLDGIESYFKEKDIPMPESNRLQALVPEGSIILENKNGTAPGFIMEKQGKIIIILPGPPKEMMPMFSDCVKPYLKRYTSETILSHNVRLFGIGESLMSGIVQDLLEGSNPTVAPYAKSGEALLRVTAKAESKEKAEQMMKGVLEEIESRLGEYIYGIDCESIEQAVADILKEKKMTVAFAESCTGGLCSKRITDISGASEIFHCSVISYADHIKNKVLGVKSQTLESYTAVSEQTAKEMAEGVRLLSGASYGVSITGYAGPGDGSEVGTIFIGVSGEKGTTVKKLVTCHRGENCREYNRHVAASNAFNELRKRLLTDS